ncbi:MAG: pantoate--beta-alanine ligase, partial [Candidatus Ratteibacteria bacterium]|nr:pantoate--beta-alanine ligase [Candidatus Ratteibacteria bacterium]
DTKIKVLPTVREKDGLAMSSRNAYLNKEQRKTATVLYRSLMEAKRLINNSLKDISELKKLIKKTINQEPSAKIDYIEIRDPETLQPVKKITGSVVILLAVRIGKVRLIDNVII